MGFRSGKLSPCTLFRGSFPEAKLSSHGVFKCDKQYCAFRPCFVFFFQLFCHTLDLNYNRKGAYYVYSYNRTIVQYQFHSLPDSLLCTSLNLILMI